MAESSFEFRLERMFADAPQAPDAELFALRVVERLEEKADGDRRLRQQLGDFRRAMSRVKS